MSKLIALLFEEEETYSQVVTVGTEGQIAPSVGPPAHAVDSEPDVALSVLKTIRQKAKEADAKLEDAVVVYKTHSGEVKIKQTQDVTTGKGARRGVFWGLLAGLILGGPIAGVLWGLGVGSIYGAAVDHGIDDKFLRNVGKWLRPNRSAVLVMVQDEDTERAIAYLETFDAEMHVSDLSEQAAEAAEKAAEHEAVSQAVKAEYDIE
jgi:uncharacterized membrane protein